ncbi:hypothetical protein GPLA_1722 [Paraglaciecola polaris LMG 21857]|uniref:Uncharacterized protein n=1 Tax=Paraglaciecola polaris LMG 21857 TaxID=1129793 RepID=K6ZQS1_9ALTE|nr:hypothetical protein GPLA_1722 [Paraglaciecola polaris LMG 21857]
MCFVFVITLSSDAALYTGIIKKYHNDQYKNSALKIRLHHANLWLVSHFYEQ